MVEIKIDNNLVHLKENMDLPCSSERPVELSTVVWSARSLLLSENSVHQQSQHPQTSQQLIGYPSMEVAVAIHHLFCDGFFRDSILFAFNSWVYCEQLQKSFKLLAEILGTESVHTYT